jgi:hypothetical protein
MEAEANVTPYVIAAHQPALPRPPPAIFFAVFRPHRVESK